MECKKQIKKVVFSHFASAMTMTLGKEAASGSVYSLHIDNTTSKPWHKCMIKAKVKHSVVAYLKHAKLYEVSMS